MKVVSAYEMREIDRRSIEEYGLPGAVLMENAGHAAADAIEDVCLEEGVDRVLVVAGKGNNGGDGFVVARHLVNRGIDTTILLIGKMADVKGDAKINLDIANKMGIEVRESLMDIPLVEEEIRSAGLLVDALLGTGLSHDVEGFYAEVIDAINMSDSPIVSLDIPSGLDASTGRVLGTTVEADMTVTFCLPKIGCIIHPGAEYVGDLILADIGAPFDLLEDRDLKTSLILKEDAAELLLPRDEDSHKGSYGHLLVVAGSIGKTGAAVLAADAAMRGGAGLVTLAAPASLNDILESKLTEVMTEPVAEEKDGFFAKEAASNILEKLESKSALVLGPGISRQDETGQMLIQILGNLSIPAVIDADAIWHLAGAKELIQDSKASLILTPHPGEMARLLGISPAEVQADRIGTSRQFAAEYGCYLVLKGARTLVVAPSGEVFINTTGNSGMASAGTGDVLAGLIGALLCQGCSPLESAIAGVWIHGTAGDKAADEKGEAGLIASDIIEKMPEVMKSMTTF